jgi:hypothetical protein
MLHQFRTQMEYPRQLGEDSIGSLLLKLLRTLPQYPNRFFGQPLNIKQTSPPQWHSISTVILITSLIYHELIDHKLTPQLYICPSIKFEQTNKSSVLFRWRYDIIILSLYCNIV